MRLHVVCVLLLAAAILPACSPKRMGINRMADALTQTAGAYGSDGDPEFVRLAAPATLKMVEMLIDDQPRHAGLLLTACSGFTQYAYGFLHVDAEIAQPRDATLARELRTRAQRMYERARQYCIRALDAKHDSFAGVLARDAKAAVGITTAADVPALFWLGASWAGALALADNQLLRLPELVSVKVVFARAIALDEAWEQGVLHEALIAIEGLPTLLGGSSHRARQHFARAVELSKGRSAFPYVTLASSVAAPAGQRAEFEKLLKQALAVDVDALPQQRLANLIAQKRARFLLSRVSSLFPGR